MKRGRPLKRVPMRRRRPRDEAEMDEDIQRGLARERAMRRAGWRCEAKATWPECRCFGDIEVHEKLQRSLGGSILDLDNLVVLCHAHHMAVHDRIALAHERGLLVHSWER
jgi:hypothetical protein